MQVPWYFYAGFVAIVVAMLLVDLRFFHTGQEEPSTLRSATWVGVWVGLALVFGAVLLFWQGPDRAGEYFAGYVIEYSLSVDNMFVFLVIFNSLGVPLRAQHRVLFLGILGALVFRGLAIALGTALIHAFQWVIYAFGTFLLYTAYKVARQGVRQLKPEDNPVLGALRRRVPATTRLDDQKLITKERDRRVATPLLLALLFIEVTDIFFALDSIPAVFGVTRQPFIMFTSNASAVLGLRALYFLLAKGLRRLHLLTLGATTALSLATQPPPEEQRAVA